MLRTIDSLLNRITMYRLIIYVLSMILAAGFVFALMHKLSISGGGLAINLAIILSVGFVANTAMAKLYSVTNNLEAGIITCLILACILPTPTKFSQGLYVALAVVIAMASKYILVWRHSPVFNPAAIAVTILSIAGLLPAIWWVGSPPMIVFTTVAALLVLRKQRKFSLFAVFAISSLVMFIIVNHVTGDQSTGSLLKTLAESYPLIFMGSIMLTEPSTLPIGRYNQVLCGLLVGSVFTSQLHIWRITATPQVALVVGNIFAIVTTYRIAATAKLSHKVKLASNIDGLHFEKPKGFQFIPGQYLEWTLATKKFDSRGNRRSFTIASSPTENDIQIGVKFYDPSSSFKVALSGLEDGQTIQLARPSGEFTLPDDQSQPLIFVAGGIGITPFRSMIKYLVDTKQKRKITLFYSASNKSEFVYRDVFDEAKSLGIKTNYVVGRIDHNLIMETIKDLDKPLVYISGPNNMVEACSYKLHKSGISNKQIHTDFFSGY